MALAIKGRPFALVGSKQSACKSSPPFLYFIFAPILSLPDSFLFDHCHFIFFLNQDIPSRLHLKLKICLVVKEPTENQKNDIPLPPPLVQYGMAIRPGFLASLLDSRIAETSLPQLPPQSIKKQTIRKSRPLSDPKRKPILNMNLYL